MQIDLSSLWALVGVILGFVLGEGSRVARQWFRIARLKKLIRMELLAIQSQIPQKRDILARMIDALGKGWVLPGVGVRIISTGYDRHRDEIYEHLTSLQRNCLHVIHERLRVADQMLEDFFTDFQAASRDKIVKDPIAAYKSLLEDLDHSYEVASDLIESYLSRKPVDVFDTLKREAKK